MYATPIPNSVSASSESRSDFLLFTSIKDVLKQYHTWPTLQFPVDNGSFRCFDVLRKDVQFSLSGAIRCNKFIPKPWLSLCLNGYTLQLLSERKGGKK